MEKSQISDIGKVGRTLSSDQKYINHLTINHDVMALLLRQVHMGFNLGMGGGLIVMDSAIKAYMYCSIWFKAAFSPF